ncbi:hypothetical protein QZH41_003209 [Actinostola sp. cb2023]|nr:hypothetical protein QZH41_003209 [Actinostola sp. cb2023]
MMVDDDTATIDYPLGSTLVPNISKCNYIGVLENQTGVACLIDDTVVYGKDSKEHDERLNQVLEKLSKANITLNKEKCQFRKSEITFLGHIVGRDGVKPDPNKVSAVVNMEAPQNVSELRRFLGMVNQLGKFLPNLATVTEPLRGLLLADHVVLGSTPTTCFQRDKENAKFKSSLITLRS